MHPRSPGPGSTSDAPFFIVAFAKYQQQHPAVTISYAAVGSSAGIAAFSARQVDFGASDVPMTTTEQAAAHGGPITQVPVDLGGEGIAYKPAPPGGRPAAVSACFGSASAEPKQLRVGRRLGGG